MLCQHILQKTAKSSVRNFPELRKDNKVLVYKAVCITTLLYGSEAWVTYRCHLKTLEKFHQRFLRKVLCIRWEDRRTNARVLMEANTISIEAMVMQNQAVLAYTRQRPNLRQTSTSRGGETAEEKGEEMSKHLHVSFPSGTSCPHCNNICRSRIALLIHIRIHDRPLEDVILVSRDC